MTNPQLAIHIEHLFATSLVIDRLEGRLVEPVAIVAAVAEVGKDAVRGNGSARARRWGASPPEWLRPVADRARVLAARSTVEVARQAAWADWRIDVAAYDVAPGEQFEPAPCYDAYWTCLFIIDDGYGGSLDNALGGELVFTDPRLPAPMMEMPDLRLRLAAGAQGAVYAPEVVVRPGSGSVIMFPSWLRLRQRALGVRAAARQLVAVSLIAPAGLS